jgi:hypothetical protein
MIWRAAGENDQVREITVIIPGGDRTFCIGMEFTLRMPIAGHPNRVPAGTKVKVTKLRTPRYAADDQVIGIQVDGITRFISPSILASVAPVSVAVDGDDVLEHHGDDSDGCGLV